MSFKLLDIFYSTKGRLIFLYLVNIQNSDSCSMSSCPKGGFSSSQRTSPLREIAGCASEQLSTGSLCSSPDDNNSFDGIKLEESEQWQLRLAYFMMFPGMVLAVCPYLDRYLLASAGNAVSFNALYLYFLDILSLYYFSESQVPAADKDSPHLSAFSLCLSVFCMWFSM